MKLCPLVEIGQFQVSCHHLAATRVESQCRLYTIIASSTFSC